MFYHHLTPNEIILQIRRNSRVVKSIPVDINLTLKVKNTLQHYKTHTLGYLIMLVSKQNKLVHLSDERETNGHSTALF